MSNTITAYFKGRIGVAESVYQNDYGIVMAFDSIDLPAHFDCYFSRLNQEEALPGVGADNRVTIPNSILANPGNVTIHIPLHTGEDDSEVEYVIYFKVIGRARPIDDGTPTQMTAIERALALLSQPITNIEEIVNEALSFTGDTFAEMKQELQDDFDNYTDTLEGDLATWKSGVESDIDDVEADFDVLQGQFDTAVAAVTTDTEVTDIRVGADGVTDTTAGASVRRQFTDVKSAIHTIVEPLYSPDELEKAATAVGGKLSGEGLWVVDANFAVDKYIVTPNKLYFIKVKGNGGVTYQWQNTATISSYSTAGVVGTPHQGESFEVVQAPSTATYLMICHKQGDYDNGAYTFIDYVSFLKNYPQNEKKTLNFMEKPYAETTKATLQLNGVVYENAGFSDKLGVSPMLLVDSLKGKTIKGICSWVAASDYPLAFYDTNQNIIGEAYISDADTSQHSVDVVINDALIAQFPNAKYIRLALYSDYPMMVFSEGDIERNIQNQYMLYNYSNALFCGDSVTAGFVTDDGIYEVESEYSYPSQFKKQNYGIDVTTIAQSGISALGWYRTYLPTADFADKNLIVFEFGYNTADGGRFDIDDWDVPNTNTNAYRQIVQKARYDSPKALIVLAISSHSAWTYDWAPTLNAIANESDCYVIDLADTKYLNLDTTEYHAVHDGDIDWAHFTRKGYNAKAYVVKNMLMDIIQYQMN